MKSPVDYFLRAQDASPDPYMVFRAIRTPAGVIADFEWIYANPASERLLHRAPERLTGRRLLAEMAGSPVQGLFDAFARVVDRNVGFRKADFVPRENDETTFRLTAVRVEDGIALLASDVTPMIEAERALREMEEKLLQAQKMETLGRLVGGVAHDFNNMLSAIMMNAHLLLKQLPEGDPSRKYSTEIDSIAVHAAALTHQILAYSGKQAPEARVFSLNGVISDFSAMLRRLIGEEIELQTHLDPELGRIKADAVQMQQVILNLVINARDAIPGGGTITLETENVLVEQESDRFPGVEPGRFVMLAVRDTGGGMSREIQPRVFDAHFSTKDEGTGLGLATVHSIVEKTNGHSFVESEVGEGTTFRILIPEATEAASLVERRASPARAPGGDETILLVEDERKLRVAMRRTLERKGYRVLEARHGREALEVAERHEGEIHLLVADMVMPVMGGRLLAQELESRRPGTRVLFMSGYVERGSAGTEWEADLLLKPFTPYALAWKVRESIDGKTREPGAPAAHRLG
jgi:two-component system, cell cycle sensor histidine kinase and response regulator CckA